MDSPDDAHSLQACLTAHDKNLKNIIEQVFYQLRHPPLETVFKTEQSDTEDVEEDEETFILQTEDSDNETQLKRKLTCKSHQGNSLYSKRNKRSLPPVLPETPSELKIRNTKKRQKQEKKKHDLLVKKEIKRGKQLTMPVFCGK